MRLILVRHGETDSNVGRLLDTGYPGAPLNETGLAQAQALVAELANEPVDAIYSSDLTRAIQTAAPLAKHFGLTPVADQSFREIYAGEHDMSPDWQPYVDVMFDWLNDPSAALPGMESFLDFEARWQAGIDALVARRHDCAVIVSHGAAMRIWAPYVTGFTAAEAHPLRNTDRIVLEGTPGSWELHSWAQTQFLSA